MFIWLRGIARSHEKLKLLYIYYHKTIATKLGRIVTYLQRLQILKSNDHIIIKCRQKLQQGGSFHKITRSFDHVVLQGHVKYQICYISTTATPMTTKLGKVLTWYEKLSSITFCNPLNTWRSSGKLRALYLIYHNDNGHQTWQSVTEKLPSKQSHDPLIMWSCKVTCQIKYVISLLSPGLCPLKLHMVIYYEVLPPMNSHKHLDIHSLVSKVSSVVTKGETLTTINSHGQSIKWFFEVT